MSTAAKLIGYVAILAVALIGAFGIGTAVGPIDTPGSGGEQEPAHERVQDAPRDDREDQDQPHQQDDEHEGTIDEHAE